jgi:hypothetical protein
VDILVGFLREYWGLLLIVVAFLIYLFSLGRAEAKQILLSLMLRAEKEVEGYLFRTGNEKFEFVVTRGYELLPRYVKFIITYSMFEEMAQALYNKAKEYFFIHH